MNETNIFYQLLNLKEIDYKTMLTLTSLIELLINKNIISKEELLRKIKNLDSIASQSSGI
ncbi:hypothetical protein FDN13_07520 [Caloramator sp. E03]|uniref:hypothetical protein n=1 Tax=Caloramator sp. E03 TaxID=2576307 RepID=UPI0011105DE9|nr:hypothetical protein [Caloramator sp. E03]QCX33569.1 hypothetical protein FDN13_07520 [Caloramator sp. E03]